MRLLELFVVNLGNAKTLNLLLDFCVSANIPTNDAGGTLEIYHFYIIYHLLACVLYFLFYHFPEKSMLYLIIF